MSNKKDKKQETIDERLYRELGVKPVSKDHPIYTRGASIRFISKKSEKKKYNIPFSDQNPNVQFLDNRISFNNITIFLKKILSMKNFKKYKRISPKNYNEVIKLSDYVRLKTKLLCI